jgi:hypothetical protein
VPILSIGAISLEGSRPVVRPGAGLHYSRSSGHVRDKCGQLMSGQALSHNCLARWVNSVELISVFGHIDTQCMHLHINLPSQVKLVQTED